MVEDREPGGVMAGIYIHIPFCEHKCLYCDFYSIEEREPIGGFLESLHREIDLYAGAGFPEQISTIYFGGGTPSLLEPAAIGAMLEHCGGSFSVAADAEITLEANPGTVERERLAGFRAAGVNRVSLGIQSFHDDELRFLSRIHSAADAIDAIAAARRAGISNISIDLIFALPGQGDERWSENLSIALGQDVPHISAYSLIVEPGTPLAVLVKAGQVQPSPAETEAAMYSLTMETLQKHGYIHYEVSNYARPGFRSIHNGNYWNHTPYLGLGPSAHSYRKGSRWWNGASVEHYRRRLAEGVAPVAGRESLTDIQFRDETLMLGLRSDGIDCRDFAARFGIDILVACEEVITEQTRNGRMEIRDGMLHLTDAGFLLCDSILSDLLKRLPG